MKKRKLYEIKIYVVVEFFDNLTDSICYDDDVITFYCNGLSKISALFNLLQRNLSSLIVNEHNFKEVNFSCCDIWDEESLSYTLMELRSIKLCD